MDIKGRVLNKGEDQLSDGRYRYRYTANGTRKDVYSWKLLPTDRTPKGKKDNLSLRELEKQITINASLGISSYEADKMSVMELIERYWKQCNYKRNTERAYTILINKHVKPQIGNIKISNVRPSTIRNFFFKLAEDHSQSTVNTINAVLYPAFDMAVRDGIIRSNPVIGATKGLSKKAKQTDSKKRALTLEEQRAFLNYIKDAFPYWYSFFVVAIQTGMRIGEITALTWNDCNMSDETISINKTMLYGGCSDYDFKINSPKTESGKRTIKMFPAVKKALQEQKIKGKNNIKIDSYTGFIFTTPQNNLISVGYINRLLERITAQYNAEETIKADAEHRQPLLLPKNITSHWLRYTCCTRFCENVASIDEVKLISNYLGHKNIDVTLKVYMSVSPNKENELQYRVQQNAFA